jgi:hypothetical protein
MHQGRKSIAVFKMFGLAQITQDKGQPSYCWRAPALHRALKLFSELRRLESDCPAVKGSNLDPFLIFGG